MGPFQVLLDVAHIDTNLIYFCFRSGVGCKNVAYVVAELCEKKLDIRRIFYERYSFEFYNTFLHPITAICVYEYMSIR